jgi:hypothetical protein
MKLTLEIVYKKIILIIKKGSFILIIYIYIYIYIYYYPDIHINNNNKKKTIRKDCYGPVK